MYVESYGIASYRIYYIGWYLPTYHLPLVRIGRVQQTAGLLRGRQLPANSQWGGNAPEPRNWVVR